MVKKHKDGKLYLLQATWQNKNRDYCHRLIHTHAHSVEQTFEILAEEHPEWSTTNDYTTLGEINGQHTSVTVFETVSMDNESWRLWVRKKQQERHEQIKDEERVRDLNTIRELVEKHGLNAMEVLAMAAEESK